MEAMDSPYLASGTSTVSTGGKQPSNYLEAIAAGGGAQTVDQMVTYGKGVNGGESVTYDEGEAKYDSYVDAVQDHFHNTNILYGSKNEYITKLNSGQHFQNMKSYYDGTDANNYQMNGFGQKYDEHSYNRMLNNFTDHTLQIGLTYLQPSANTSGSCPAVEAWPAYISGGSASVGVALAFDKETRSIDWGVYYSVGTGTLVGNGKGLGFEFIYSENDELSDISEPITINVGGSIGNGLWAGYEYGHPFYNQYDGKELIKPFHSINIGAGEGGEGHGFVTYTGFFYKDSDQRKKRLKKLDSIDPRKL